MPVSGMKDYWIRFDLLADNDPVGRIASTNFSWARRLVFEVACKYLLVTLLLSRLSEMRRRHFPAVRSRFRYRCEIYPEAQVGSNHWRGDSMARQDSVDYC